jgi:HAD superfamily hydrolase (TIGR01509 family)
MITSIIFDLDGTLIDSIPLHKKIFMDIAKKHHVVVTDEAFSRFNGMNTKTVFKKIMREQKLYLRALPIAFDLYFARRHILKKISIFTDTISTLTRLNKKYSMGIATSSSGRYLTKAITKFAFSPYFQAFLSSSNVTHSKPHPDIFLKAAQKLGKEAHVCVVVEDSVNGIIAGKRAGMTVIAVLTTTPKKYFTGEAKPDYFIKHLGELSPKIIEKAEKKACERRREKNQECTKLKGVRQ